MGKSLVNLINQGKIIHLEPHFPTFFTRNSTTNPDKKKKNISDKHHYLNYTCEPGELTTSDNLPIIFKRSSVPFIN